MTGPATPDMRPDAEEMEVAAWELEREQAAHVHTCMRCQQPHKLTPTYRIAHICRRCRNALIDAFNRAKEAPELGET